MTQQGETVRIRRTQRSSRPPNPPCLLRFFPLEAPPTFESYPLKADGTMLGRGEDCAIQIDDNEVSRNHAVVSCAKGVWRVLDNHSANGLFLNGERIQAAQLQGGEILRLGTTLFRFLAQGPNLPKNRYAVPQDDFVHGPSFQTVRDLLEKTSAATVSILLTGETGTGKEVAAQFVHRCSARSAKAFVPVNCAAIPDNLVESEFFGHLRGAFTGATSDRVGLVRESSGGTLFLDEIGELPLPAQAKLLRVLQEQKVRPVGASSGIPVDLRVICATNRDLGEELRAGRFRPDLYARIAEVVVRIPPLRDHAEDVPLLLYRFLQQQRAGDRTIAVETIERLCLQRWPFNVRQVGSAIRRALLLAEGSRELGDAHFPEEEDLGEAGARPLEHPAGPIVPPARRKLEDALRTHQGDVHATAAALGLSRSQLYRRAKKLGLRLADFKP